MDGTSGTVLIVDGDTGEPLCAPMLYNEKRADAMEAVEAMVGRHKLNALDPWGLDSIKASGFN